jgi:hypothetical protein
MITWFAELPGPMIAAVAAGIAALITICAALWVLRAGLRTWRTMTVGRDLIDLHLADLEQRAETAVLRSSAVADGSERLNQSSLSLRRSVSELRMLVQAIPIERRRALRKIADAVLPTPRDH